MPSRMFNAFLVCVTILRVKWQNPHLSRDQKGMVLHTCIPESPALPSFPGKPNSP